MFIQPLPTIDELVRLADKCTACELHCQPGGGVAFYDGTPNTKIMFVGEAPGENEAIQGKPFVGRAGKLLDAALNAVGIDRRKIYITNVCKHRPENNRTPTVEEQETCAQLFLAKEIEIIQPKIIVPLGNPATRFFLGKQANISKVRGTWINQLNYLVYPMFHPAYVLRNPSREINSPADLFWKDMQALHAVMLEAKEVLI